MMAAKEISVKKYVVRLSDEERVLWKGVTRSIAPLRKPQKWSYPLRSGLYAGSRPRYNSAKFSKRRRALQQAGRELLLAQSSDWAFLIKTRSAPEYATQRTKDHLLRFNRLYEQLKAEQVDLEFLGECEKRNNIFPVLNWRYYL
jgi:hypothetical protein